MVCKINSNLLENIRGWMHGSLVCLKPITQAKYFTEKVLGLPINLRKSQTLNDLQYMILNKAKSE